MGHLGVTLILALYDIMVLDVKPSRVTVHTYTYRGTLLSFDRKIQIREE